MLKRVQFMDDFNIPPDRETLEELALILLRRWHPTWEKIGQCWIKRFLQRHREDCKFVTTKQISADRANADCWETNVDFFQKVRI